MDERRRLGLLLGRHTHHQNLLFRRNLCLEERKELVEQYAYQPQRHHNGVDSQDEARDPSETFIITRTQELELPRQVDVIYLNRTADYQAGTQSSQRQTVKAVDYATVNLPIVLSDQEAKVVADVTLYNVWVGRVQYQFTMPPKYALLEPTDVITVTKDGASYVMRINSTKLVRNGMQELTAVAEDVSSYDFYNPAGTGTPNIQPPTSISATRLELLDLPAFPTDAVTDAYLRYGVVGLGGDWTGSAIYRSDELRFCTFALVILLTVLFHFSLLPNPLIDLALTESP